MKSFKKWVKESHPEINENFFQGAKNFFNKVTNSNVAQNAKNLASSGTKGVGKFFDRAEKLIAQPGDNINDMVEKAERESIGKTLVLVFNDKNYVFKNGKYTG